MTSSMEVKIMKELLNKKTSITLNGFTKQKLDVLGNKGTSYNDIIDNLIHQRNILMIHSLCQGEVYENDDQLEDKCNKVFSEIDFIFAPPFQDRDGNLTDWKSFDHCLEWAMEMALDEDFIGQDDRKLPLGEVVTNVYCLINEISAPTWGNGAMRNPFAP